MVHRSGLNNENNKNQEKKNIKSKIKDFLFNSTYGKSWYFLSQGEKESLLINEDDIRKIFSKKYLIF